MKTIAKHLGNIKSSGMSHLKFELEASLGRSQRRVQWACGDCTGRRIAPCSDCNGTGAAAQRSLLEPHVECIGCNGNGGRACQSCMGRGHRGNFNDLETCQEYIFDQLALSTTGKTLAELRAEGKELGDRDGRGGQSGGTALPFVTYAKFYYDGSVDSELTITIPVEEGEKSLDILNAFKKLAEISSGGHIDTRGAGMHIAVLPEGCDGYYPADVRLDARGLTNFINEVTKLLPALYFVGTSNHRSRTMQYRSPRITNDSKYSAIYTVGRRCFEFRVFETCYDRPEAVYEYLQVISNALKFYADPTRKVKTLGKSFGFPSSTEIANYYNTTEQLRILNATVKYLKPEDKSYKQMKAERGVKYTISSLATKEKSRLAQLRADYNEYKKHFDYIQSKPLNEQEKASVDWYMLEENYTRDEAERLVRSNRGGRLEPFSEFLRRNLTKQRLSATVAV